MQLNLILGQGLASKDFSKILQFILFKINSFNRVYRNDNKSKSDTKVSYSRSREFLIDNYTQKDSLFQENTLNEIKCDIYRTQENLKNSSTTHNNSKESVVEQENFIEEAEEVL